MPWLTTSYQRYYFFRRRRMIWIAVLGAFILAFVWYGTGKYLGDPSYVPEWKIPRCHGRKCGLGLLMYLAFLIFLSLPVWIKLPIAGYGVGETLWRIIALLYWSFDSRPDFAIGPNGIYGMCGFRYHHVPWSKIGGIHETRTRTAFGAAQSLKIYTKVKFEPRAWWPKPKKRTVKFSIAPIHGMPINQILADVRAFAPERKIIVNNLDMRPKLFRWLDP